MYESDLITMTESGLLNSMQIWVSLLKGVVYWKLWKDALQISFGIAARLTDCNGWFDINCSGIELHEGEILNLTISVGPFCNCESSGMIIVKYNNVIVQNTMHLVEI